MTDSNRLVPSSISAYPCPPLSSASPGATGPSAGELLQFVCASADDAALVSSVPYDQERRTWIRLDGPQGSEAWIICWPPGTGTGWHDHGSSCGAFATATGVLTEDSLMVPLPAGEWETLELAEGIDCERHLTAGNAREFGRHHVHDVHNDSNRNFAVSVHAYYPPLQLMRRYSRQRSVFRLDQVEQPEEW